MRFSRSKTALVTLAALLSTASAVSLASFDPPVENLPSACQTVYRTKIDGCIGDDFKPKAVCSSACVQGLLNIAAQVKRSCANVDTGETSIIGVFQNGLGLASLCPNNASPSATTTTAAATTSSARAVQPSSSAARATSQPTSSAASSPKSDAPRSSATTSASSPDSTSLMLFSSTAEPRESTSSTLATSATARSSATPASTPNSQLSNQHSGGGSPFDVVATGAAVSWRWRGEELGIVVCGAVLGFLVFI